MGLATLNKWMFRTDSCREAGLIHICPEIIQRKKAVIPGEDSPQRVWRKSGTFIHASASLYHYTSVFRILCFLRDDGSERIRTANRPPFGVAFSYCAIHSRFGVLIEVTMS